MISVNYELLLITDSDLIEISESRLNDEWENLLPLIHRQDILEAVVIVNVPGQPEGRIQDEMWALIGNLCLRVVTELTKNDAQNFVINLTNTEDHVVLLPLANQVRIMGENINAITAPREALLHALFECGLRMYTLLAKLGEGQQAVLEYLRPFMDDARRVLA